MSQPLSIVADQQILFAKEAFSDFGKVTLVDGRSIEQQTIENADVLLVRSVTRVDKALLENSPVRFVGSATSGIDHIDLAYLENSDIYFTHAPGSNARSVAEYVLSSLFAVSELHEFSLAEKTVGIIGCGQVGSRLKRFLNALGVKCLINDPPLALSTGDNLYVELEEALTADIISLHVPLNLDGEFPTKDLLNKSLLSRLKADVILINTSRGEVINEIDVLEFKKNNPDSTLILDVWRNEPEINLDLLQQTLIATPHIAGYSLDGKLKATRILLDALIEYTGHEAETSNLSFLDQEQHTLELENDIVQLAVMQSYDVRSDAVALRNLVTFEEKECAAYFDSLRKNYPVRREFTCRIIRSDNMSNEVADQLEQLGFKLNTT